MTEVAQPLIDARLVTRESIQGCSRSEIDRLMTIQGVTTLPRLYEEFMTFGGRNPYWLNRGGEWDFEWLLEAKQVAREIVEDDYKEDFTPYADSFIFQTHQGYMFHYFAPEDLATEDPHFWVYTATKPPRRSTHPFSGWIRMLAEELPRAIELEKRFHRKTR